MSDVRELILANAQRTQPQSTYNWSIETMSRNRAWPFPENSRDPRFPKRPIQYPFGPPAAHHASNMLPVMAPSFQQNKILDNLVRKAYSSDYGNYTQNLNVNGTTQSNPSLVPMGRAGPVPLNIGTVEVAPVKKVGLYKQGVRLTQAKIKNDITGKKTKAGRNNPIFKVSHGKETN